MAIQTSVKKWGNSMGIILPKNFVEEKKLEENDIVIVNVVKKANISHLVGSLKRKMSGQEFKEMVKKEWEK
ncbi:MAG: hypothetical protein AABX03_05200 [Nanoarchaeota archaeon]